MVRLCIISGNRSDWGLLKGLANELDAQEDFSVTVGVVGRPGGNFETWDEVDAIWSSPPLYGDTPEQITWAFGNTIMQCGRRWDDAAGRPDAIIVLGDRWEILSAVVAAHIARIKVIHIHGGEVTAGAYDDAFRHAITKMSQLHFVATEEFRRRVVQLGENPEHVFNVGALGCDNLPKRDPSKTYNRAIVAWYPETLSDIAVPTTWLVNIVKEFFADVVVIGAQPDVGSGDHLGESYPREEFLKLLAESDLIIGNSSAGIIEAPAIQVPSINIGRRQEGRSMADSIWSCAPAEDDIRSTIQDVIGNKFWDFQKWEFGRHRPYGGDGVAKKIVQLTREWLPKVPLQKGFRDM